MIALVFIGQTGSGKTTLAKAVAERLGITRISSGDIARRMAETDTFVKAELSQGEMAPELAMREEVAMCIEEAVAMTGDFVIEGYPRTLAQLYLLESVPNIRPLYFYMDCDQLVCLRRLIGRSRAHDHADAVATRFRYYEQTTEPLLSVLNLHITDLDAELDLESLAIQVAEDFRTAKAHEEWQSR